MLRADNDVRLLTFPESRRIPPAKGRAVIGFTRRRLYPEPMSYAPPSQSSLRSEEHKPVIPWALWDAGASSFHAVMTTFVFNVYLTSELFGSKNQTSQALSIGLAAAGLIIAVTAPVTGQRADRGGSRRTALAVTTAAVAVCVALCFFVRPDPAFLWLGVGLIAMANVFSEIATVHYNAVLPSISTPRTVGRVSGLGWSFGYFGGIVALVIVLFGFVSPGLLGIPEDDSLNLRAVALFSAIWLACLSLPILLRFPGATAPESGYGSATGRTVSDHKESWVDSYRRLGRTIRRLYSHEPVTLRFLIASAVFRDGLAGVFTYGGVLAAGTFGFSTSQVIVFAIAGNVVAGLGAVIGGRLDDALGPKRVIIGSLSGLLIAAAPLLLVQGPGLFWVCGLALCAFVGPAQSASRTYLSRLTEPGDEGEYFGLYSTTGRAMSFLAPALFALFVGLLGDQVWGILGIMIVLAAGLALAVRLPARP